MKAVTLSTVVAALLLTAAFTSTTQAVLITSGNSSVVIDPDSGITGGAQDWVVDGTDHLKQMWFWYRLSSDTAEIPVSNLTKVFELGGGGDNFYTVAYDNSGQLGQPTLDIEITFLLNGGAAGSNISDLQVSVNISNLTNAPMTIDFFQFTDFDLSGNPNNDTAQIVGNDNATIQDDLVGPVIQETVVGPMPSAHEVNFAADLLAKLTNSSIDNLNNNNGPLTGDVAWAFQWSATIPANGSLIISKDMLVTPEPATLAILSAGAVMMLTNRRRRDA